MKTEKQSRILLCIGVLVCSSWVGCGDDAEEEHEELPDVDCPDTPPAYADVQAFKVECVTCHSSKLSGDDRMNAPADVNFDTESAAEAHAEEAAHEVFEGEMPPEGSGVTLSDAKKKQLYEWALCM